MVRQLKFFLAFLKLIRIYNLLIIAATQYILRWFVVKPLLQVAGFRCQLSEIQFLAIVLATVSLAAAGYVINDYFDRKTDLINRPGKVIVGRLISRRAAMLWHFIFNASGIFLGGLVAYKIGHLSFTLVFVLISGVLWFYSTTYKSQLLLGNFIIAVLVAFVPLMILLYELPLLIKEYRLILMSTDTRLDFLVAWIVSYAGFAFLLTLIREIAKDVEDFEGDFAFGRQTVPIVWGVRRAKIIIISLTLITLAAILIILLRFLLDPISIVYVSITILLPLLISMWMLWKAKQPNDYHRLSTVYKIIMFAGLMYSLVAFYIISSFS